MKITFIGLTVSSSWGNGHATTYRGLLRSLTNAGHDVTFLEHNKPWYRDNRDFSSSKHYRLVFYDSVEELKMKHKKRIRESEMVIVGSYVPQGVEVCQWVLKTAQGVTAFYDIDTPVTLQKLDLGDEEYLSTSLIPEFDIYLSFSGGEVLEILENKYGARNARALYCSVDPELYYPMDMDKDWLLGYLGTYSDDRQPTVNRLMLKPATILQDQEFVIAGPNYPGKEKWPENVQHIDHLAPDLHCEFYNRQKLTLNVTRVAMINLGYSPSVRLFEAAACGVPIVSDYWKGLTDLFEENKEIFIARSTEEMMNIILNTPEDVLVKVGAAARRKVLELHTSEKRAQELLSYYSEVNNLVEAGNANSLDL